VVTYTEAPPIIVRIHAAGERHAFCLDEPSMALRAVAFEAWESVTRVPMLECLAV